MEQIKSGEVAPAVRKAAARGILPVSREELIEILVFLADDPDETLAQEARKSLDAFPEDVLKHILESSFTSEAIFDYFARPPFRSQQLIESVILNTAAPDRVIARLSSEVETRLIDAVLINLMRLLRYPEILDALEKNSNNTPDTRRRLGEIRVEFFEKRNTFVPVAPFSPSEEYGESTPGAEEASIEFVEPHPLSTDQSHEAVVEATTQLLVQDGEEMSGDRVTLLQKIARMTIAERVQTAIKGVRDERLILIRDSNKVVSRAVLLSPKISENEIEAISQMRNVNEEILRLVGQSRSWAKNYGILHNLVRNSRSPIGVTLTLLNRLMARDLKSLSRNKNIPEVIRKSSQRLVNIREGGQR
ncbi:MAG: hypothetical protein LAO31_12425 [Acidobacteriia bacterium]|nr:hypothetical protein [Terriglobia bacterium]